MAHYQYDANVEYDGHSEKLGRCAMVDLLCATIDH
jgi:hypothetical protein